MKKLLSLLLAFSFLLSGCGFWGSIKEPVTFYYLCRQYPQDLCCVIVPEEREASGHAADLSYLLALYQMGPVDENARTPLPSGIRIQSQRQETGILLELSESAQNLTELDFSLACACLTLTTLDITGADTVTIICGDRTKIMDRSSLTLYDATEKNESTEETS